jgi:hypothetical protein
MNYKEEIAKEMLTAGLSEESNYSGL